MTSRKLFFYVFIVFLIILPWVNTDIQNDYSVPKVSQENISFYEINPCKISLLQFITNNIESIYQNHYYFRPNNKSPIECFGRVAGVTVMQKNLETQFIISIGTNSLINLVFQGLLWLFIISLVPRNLKSSEITNKYKNLSILLLAYLFSYSIYGESRFYENNLYEFNFSNIKSYFLVFLTVFLISKNLIDIYEERSENLINFIPFIYLFTFIFSGFNFSFIAILFIYLGITSFFNGEGNTKFNYLYVTLSIWWLINSNGSFYFNVGKLRGFTNSVYEFNANLFWILFIYLFLNGIYKFYIKNKTYFNFDTFVKNLSLTSLSLLLFGILSSNVPLFNFFSYYFLGLQRYGVSSNTPFAFDEFGVKISWRGIFPSSETIGEFYGLALLILLFWIIKKEKVGIFQYIGIFSASLGLYFSDNRTAIVLVFLLSLLYVYLLFFKKIINPKFLVLFAFVFSVGFILLLMASTSYEFTSTSIISQSLNFQYDSIYSSYLNLLLGQEDGSISKMLFGLFSTLGYFLNRSEMWGLFVSRYNPTFTELLIGSGPMSFGQLYGEVVINDPESFLLPHSSIFSLFVFIGIIPLGLLIIYLITTLIKNRKNYEFVLFSIYVVINIVKNDSLNYFVVFLFYYFLFLIFRNRNRL